MGDAEDKRLAFRVGINIGDVIVEAHDIFGDGARLCRSPEGVRRSFTHWRRDARPALGAASVHRSVAVR
jgi:hypothetical protein